MVFEDSEGNIYFSPWEYVLDILETTGESEEGFRKAVDMSKSDFNLFKWGLWRVTDEMAKRLEEWSGVGSKTWLNLQNAYDEKQ